MTKQGRGTDIDILKSTPPDKGCALADSCLNCPFPECIEDKPDGRRTPHSDNHNGEAESLQSTVKQRCLYPYTGLNSSTDKPGKIEQPLQVPSPTPTKPQRSPRIVPDKDWYAPYEITFHSKHMLFLIKHLRELKEGLYPLDPLGSGYIDRHVGKKAIKHKAYFEMPASIAGEVEARLNLCGLDGLILKALILWEETPQYLAKCQSMSEEQIIRRKSRALAFISGFERKRISYREFISHRKTRG
jgi:hypothetical protein